MNYTAFSTTLASRIAELLGAESDKYNPSSHISSNHISSVNCSYAFTQQSYNELCMEEELKGSRKVRFSEINDVRAIGGSPNSPQTTGESTPLNLGTPSNGPVPGVGTAVHLFDLEKIFPNRTEDSCSFLDDSKTENDTDKDGNINMDKDKNKPRQDISLSIEMNDIDSYSTQSQSVHSQSVHTLDTTLHQHSRGPYFEGGLSSYSSMDTLDCNDLLALISIINEGEIPLRESYYNTTHSAHNSAHSAHKDTHRENFRENLREKEKDKERMNVLSARSQLSFGNSNIDKIMAEKEEKISRNFQDKFQEKFQEKEEKNKEMDKEREKEREKINDCNYHNNNSSLISVRHVSFDAQDCHSQQ